jgi:hypothetical protein
MSKETFISVILAMAAGLGFVIYREQLDKAIDVVGDALDKWDNNPLNIRGTDSDNTAWVGEKPSERNAKNYVGFLNEKYSFRAGFIIIRNYRRRHGLSTIRDILYRWAPPSDNNHTENYIRYVADKMGVSDDYQATDSDMSEMLAYMADFETGEHGARPPLLVKQYLGEFGFA